MNNPINDGGPAFPITENGLQGYNGMTLRDWFAGQALAGLLSLARPDASIINDAYTSYSFADAMLAAREVKP